MYLDPRFKTLQEQKRFLIKARLKCDASFLFFVKFFFKEIEGKKFITNTHHHELEEHFNDVFNYKLKLLNINIPPRCSKTEMLLFFICRGFGMRPTSNWLMITGGDKLRKNASIKIRRIITHPFYQIMYGLELAKDQNNVDVLRSTKGGGVVTASIGGTITGFGAGEITEQNTAINKDTLNLIREFEGCQCWDDLNKMNDSAVENANNDKVTDIVFDTLMSRENSADTPIIHIQQRAGVSDVTANLMEHYEYDEKTKKCKDEKYRFVIMPIIYPDGRLLWSSKYPLWKVDELRNSEKTAHVFQTQYLQDVTNAKGALFNKQDCSFMSLDDMLRLEEQLTVGVNDVADQGNDNYSFPWGFVCGDKFYIKGWIYNSDELEINRPATAEIINYNQINNVAVEINGIGKPHIDALELSISTDVYLYGKREVTNKHLRIRQWAETIRSRFVFRNDVEVNSDYYHALNHLFKYKKTKKENKAHQLDAPDSLALLAWFLRSDELGALNLWDFV